jgi:putative phosphoribosyl transferase
MVHHTSGPAGYGLSGPLFGNREDAGRRLAERLQRFKARRPVVLALPRGGVPVGLEVAKALEAPLDLVLVRKIGVPFQPELAYAAVVDGGRPETVVNEEVAAMLHLPEDYLAQETARHLEEIKRRRQLYLAGRPHAEVADHTAVIVDDGIATGTTVRAALKAVRRARPGKLVLAVPVAPPDTIEALRKDADEIVCLATPGGFGAISLYYADFHQVSDEEVVALLAQSAAAAETPKPSPTA